MSILDAFQRKHPGPAPTAEAPRWEAPTCDHPDTFLARQTQRDGQHRFGIQCSTCGDKVGKFVGEQRCRDEHGVAPGTARPYDENLRNAWWEAHQRRWTELRESTRAADRSDWNRWYLNYLDSSAWHARRKLVLERARWICEGCGEAQATQVHHKTYERVGNEMLFDLLALCRGCHSRLHDVP